MTSSTKPEVHTYPIAVRRGRTYSQM